MAKAKAELGTSDVFMNFAMIRATINAANSSTLAKGSVQTGLSVRGNLAWLIHRLELIIPTQNDGYNWVDAVLSANPGHSTLPSLDDDGVIAHMREGFNIKTSGASPIDFPKKDTFMPPVIYAKKTMNLYVKSNTDYAGYRNKDVLIRIGYTTIPVEEGTYTEVAETWGNI